jgi:hypothetical protein
MYNLQVLAETLATLKETEIQDLADILVHRDHQKADSLDFALRVSQQEFLMAHGFSEKIIDVAA